MLDQAQDFLDESRALHALIAPLSDAEMATETQFKGWTIDTVIQHLHFFNIAADFALTDEPALLMLFEALAEERAAGGTMLTYTERYLKGLKGRALVADWIALCERLANDFMTVDPKRRLKWAGPDMSARSFITARLMETWAHGQEIYDILGVERVDGDRIRNIAMLGVNTYKWTFIVRGEPVPETLPHVVLTAPSGVTWAFNEPSSVERVEGSATEFCQVVAQTRNVADTSLKATGPAAIAWMSKAQCFAGGPETPPAPGTRFRVARG